VEHSKSPWLAGSVLLAVVFVALSFADQKPHGPPPPFAGTSVPFPHPRDMVRVVQGESYQVPAGKILTLREFVATSKFGGTNVLAVDGQRLCAVGGLDFGENQLLELGITATAGQVVTIEAEFPPAPAPIVAIGFLVDA
jgi:hypothetical protein